MDSTSDTTPSTPKRDTFHEMNPKVNEWMHREAAGKAPPMSSQLLRLADRIGQSPEDLAKKIPADTLRRLKYPLLETENPDGTRSFKHDIGASDDLTVSLRR